MLSCAVCRVHACCSRELDKSPGNCPCKDIGKIEEVMEYCRHSDVYETLHQSTKITSQGYGIQTRLEETMAFARASGYQNIGLAFCLGLAPEAKVIHQVLTHNGFAVNSVICKMGGMPKENIGVNEPVTMCNPVGQARFLNEAKTELNIVVGLCVGHDSLFIKHSEALVTVFAVKDRVLGHNPLAAVYQAETYYRKKLFP